MKQEPTAKGKAILQRSFRKLVIVGKDLGISAQDIIELLNSGMTVTQLFEYLENKSSGILLES